MIAEPLGGLVAAFPGWPGIASTRRRERPTGLLQAAQRATCCTEKDRGGTGTPQRCHAALVLRQRAPATRKASAALLRPKGAGGACSGAARRLLASNLRRSP